MGPTNVALVKLYEAEQALRSARTRLENASRNVRVQERRIADVTERLHLAQAELREQQAAAAQLDLDVKTRDVKIERLRRQQQNAKNLKEYQAFLTEINTEKIDKGKVEDEEIKALEQVEKLTAQVKELSATSDADNKKLAEMQQQLSGQLAQLQAEVERLTAARDQAATTVPPRALNQFERLSERYEGEAMAPIGKPDRRREEYVCTACNMSLVTDMYNRLHARDEPVVCPNCRRLLYIPDDLPPETAINLKPARKNHAAPTESAAEKVQ